MGPCDTLHSNAAAVVVVAAVDVVDVDVGDHRTSLLLLPNR